MRPAPSLVRRVAAGILASICLGAFAAPVAEAEFGPIQLISKSAKEQADIASVPAISADGRFVVFAATIGGHTGLFRKELGSGVLSMVVEGDAEAPSISASGRYVSFATGAQLDPINDPQLSTRDVYVADLVNPSAPAFELASAKNESPEALGGSSRLAPRVALSSDGRRVAFVNAGQVYVRDLETEATTLVSVRRDPVTGTTTEPVPGGGAYLGSTGASLSADGTTVAWVGEHLPEQVPLLLDEEERIRKIEAAGEFRQYLEPLWRRVPSAADPLPPTRRIIGGGDPLAPGCGPNGSLGEPACQGPYPELTKNHKLQNVNEGEGRGWGPGLPQLSADGDTVAVIGDPNEGTDLFVVDMHAGLSRRAAVRQVTRWTNPAPGENNPEKVFLESNFWPFTGKITDCAISADGTRLAFTTARQFFPLAPPTLISPLPTGLGTVSELYQVSLDGQTIERVTPGPGQSASLGGPTGGGAESPSFGAGGRVLSFSSTARNLVSGDANEKADVFVVEALPGSPVLPSVISPAPARLVTKPQWLLSAKAISRPDGSIRVVAVVPDTGTLRAKAGAQLGARLHTRRVARASRRSRSGGVLRLDLSLPRQLRHLAREQGGLFATVGLSFTGRGGKPLHDVLGARFRTHRASKGGKK